MPAGALKAIRIRLHLSNPELAGLLRVGVDTVKKWQRVTGGDPIPYRVPAELAAVARRLSLDATAVADGIDALWPPSDKEA
ncbi:MAG: hypothetical protein LBJ44_05825 [Propionibacteriaceae bacterium]|jgi:hypothetical protein|nr:hypothetical protein [Propionibacteriaceae bacterium]